MKINTSLLLFFIISFCQAQNKGTITPKDVMPRAGRENHYIYLPPSGLLLPKKIAILVVYQSRQTFYQKSIPLFKVANGYSFSFKAPDSVPVLIFSIIDALADLADFNLYEMPPKKIVDNNNKTGFISYLYNKAGKRFKFENIPLAWLLNDYARYFLELKIIPKPTIIQMYETAYRFHPELRNENSYPDYLTLVYERNPAAAEQKLLAYAKQMMLVKANEFKWFNAKTIYALLKMDKELGMVENKILSTFPNGELAREKYLGSYFQSHSRGAYTEQTIIEEMNNYVKRFNDSTQNSIRYFKTLINSVLKEKKDWVTIFRFGELDENKFGVAGTFHDIAWGLSGKQLDSSGNDLETGKLFSKKSLNIIEELMKKPVPAEGYEIDLQGQYNFYANTYALILYNLGQYDSALYYQDAIYQQGREFLNTKGMERYAVYAEKAKGVLYAKQVLEKALLSGTNSPVMVERLQSIYKQLNLPEDEFNRLQENNYVVAKEKNSALIKGRFGTVAAKKFVMQNILGQTVTLSALKNKVVILDFWATWCVPCRASFPAMQELVNKYKGDTNVVFLFVDTKERSNPEKMKADAMKIMQDNQYTFNVVLDIKNKVVTDYKVEAIPVKFVIDKRGDIVMMGGEISEITFAIEAEKKQ